MPQGACHLASGHDIPEGNAGTRLGDIVPGRGVLVLDACVKDQRGEQVYRAVWTTLMARQR